MILKSHSYTYEIEETLSEKKHHIVYVALRKNPKYSFQQRVVLKIFRSKVSYSLELESLLKVQSPYLVSVWCFERINNKEALVLEWIEGLSLFEFLKKNPRLSETEIQCICWQIQQGLLCLKKYNICHGDLSLDNVLIDWTGKVCLIDFGKANYLGGQILSTPGFVANEIKQGKKPTFYSDLFSLGLIEETLRSRSGSPSSKDQIKVGLSPNSLLNFTPKNRKIKSYSFHIQAQEKLSEKVQGIMNQNQIYKEKTKVFGVNKVKPPFFMSHRFVWVLFTPLLFLVGGLSGEDKPSSLNIRSHHWLYVKVARQEGYTPFSSRFLKSGNYIVEWKGNQGSGFKKLHLKKGEHLLITDADLLTYHSNAHKTKK